MILLDTDFWGWWAEGNDLLPVLKKRRHDTEAVVSGNNDPGRRVHHLQRIPILPDMHGRRNGAGFVFKAAESVPAAASGKERPMPNWRPAP